MVPDQDQRRGFTKYFLVKNIIIKVNNICRESSDGEILPSSSSEDKEPSNFKNFKFKPLESMFSLKLATVTISKLLPL